MKNLALVAVPINVVSLLPELLLTGACPPEQDAQRGMVDKLRGLELWRLPDKAHALARVHALVHHQTVAATVSVLREVPGREDLDRVLTVDQVEKRVSRAVDAAKLSASASAGVSTLAPSPPIARRDAAGPQPRGMTA